MVAAAIEVSVRHKTGDTARSLTSDTVERVTASLDNCVVLIEDSGHSLCIVTLNVANVRDAIPVFKQTLSASLGLPEESIALFVSHNHCDVELSRPDKTGSGVELTEAGHRLLSALNEAARSLRTRLVPVTVSFGKGTCDDISYIRKGRRHDGTTYFMREEDRVELGSDYSGPIDSDAPVISLIDTDNAPVCHIVSFSAHPVTAYHPEQPIVAGEYCQTASRYLGDWTGNTPVAFIQGCAGDTNSKRFLTLDSPVDKVQSATLYGTRLGAAYTEVVCAEESETDDFTFDRHPVRLQFGAPPSREEVTNKIEEIEAFLARCAAGDEDTLSCAGLNASRTMSPRYRTSLLSPVYDWYRWVEDLHAGKAIAEDGADFDVLAIRLGDVAIVGLACEPFSTIGLAIKANSPAKLTVTGGYFDRFGQGYVPDGKNYRDLDYVSSFYRYRIGMLPFAHPAGDLLADEAVRSLTRLFE